MLRFGWRYCIFCRPCFLSTKSSTIPDPSGPGLKSATKAIISSKQFVRIYNNFEVKYNNHPWPRYYSETLENTKNDLEEVFKNEQFFYFIPKKS